MIILFLIALGTNSCTASVPESYNCCGTKLGISSQVFVFGIPIGTSAYKPTTAIRLVVLSMFMAESYAIGVSIHWIILLVFLATILSISLPAIPGGAMLIYAMLFSQLGIPADALAIAFATDIFFDLFSTAGAQIVCQFGLLHVASQLDLLDEKMLQSES